MARALGGLCGLALLLGTASARADCVDVFGCVCGAYDVVIVATVLEVRADGYASVELERIEGSVPGEPDPWSVGDVVDALPDIQVRQGARAYLTNAGDGATDLLVQFSQAEPSGEIECSGALFDEEELIETALSADCIDRARARGIENHCVDEGGCSVAAPSRGSRSTAHGGWWLVGLALGFAARRRR